MTGDCAKKIKIGFSILVGFLVIQAAFFPGSAN